jgi:hypothetical protein
MDFDVSLFNRRLNFFVIKYINFVEKVISQVRKNHKILTKSQLQVKAYELWDTCTWDKHRDNMNTLR